MTLDEMKTYFQLLLAETTTSSDFVSSNQMADLINLGCEIFSHETRCIRPTHIFCTLVTGQSSYNLSPKFLAIEEGVFLFNNLNAYHSELTPAEEGYKTFIINDSSNGLPQEYAVRGFVKTGLILDESGGGLEDQDEGYLWDETKSQEPIPQIVFDPPPSSDYNGWKVRIYCSKWATPLTSASDASDIPVIFHRAPVVAAVATFKERDQEHQQASYYWGDPIRPRRGSYYWWVNYAKNYLLAKDRTITGWRFAEGMYVNR